MDFLDYKPESAIQKPILESGTYIATISKIEEGKTVSGLDYVSVICDVETAGGQGTKFSLFLVAGEKFNINATLFFDTFGIDRGNFDYSLWEGKSGQIFISVEDDKLNPNWIIDEDGYAGTEKEAYEYLPWPARPMIPSRIVFSN